MTKAMVLAIALTTVGLATAARADRPAGDTCAAKLDADAKAIYAATMAAGPTTDTLRSVVEQQTRSLAMAGKIGRGEARENARAAGECVRAGLQ